MIPINALSALHIEEVFAKAVIDEVASGRYVFKKGDRDNQSVYLLDGQVELLDGRKVVGKVGAGSEAAHHPLAHKQPRQLSVRASGQATVARIDSSLLDVLLTWDESSGYDVVDIEAEDDDDWMTRMLQSRAFVQLPPSSIHQLLMRLEAVTASAGDVIVNQGQDGDFFYIVKSGRLAVTRKASSRSNEVMLAELGQGDCFGEDALVSGAERNATVRMITDGWLMRLSRDDFDELLRASLVHEVSYAEAEKLVDDGTCWLDVRLPGEFSNRAIQGSINVPLSALRGQTDQLDSQCTYVVYCDTGRRSSAGAFILGQLGYQVYVLSNGLMDVPDEATSGDCPQVSAAQPDQEAEIIPFGNVTAQPEIKASDTTAADDAAFREQLETALLTNAELQQEIEDRQQQIERLIAGSELQGSEKEQLQQRIATLEASFAGEQATRASQRSELELQNRELTKEMDGLRTSAQERDQQFNELIRERDSTSGQLAQSIQEVDMLQEQLEQQLQEAGQQTSEAGEREQLLQEQLEQLDQAATADREELVQASAATSADRQELVGQLETLQAQIDQLQNAASAEQGELGEQLQALQTQLEEQTQQLTEQQSQREQLETRLEQQLQEAGQQTSEAGEREQSLQEQLEQLDQAATAAREELVQASAATSADRQELVGQLETLQAQIDQLQNAASAEQGELGEQLQALQTQLEEQTQQLTDQQSQREQLETQLEQQLEQQLQEAGQQASEAGEREQLLQEQLEQLDQAATAAREELAQASAATSADRQELVGQLETLQAQIDQLQNAASAEQGELGEQLQALQTQLEEQTQQLTDQQSQREQLETRLEQQLQEAGQQTSEAGEREQSLQAQLEEAGAQNQASVQQVAELEASLAGVAREHKRDIDSVRDALARAQDERENTKREQSRLMESLRKAESRLDGESHEHEAEVYRLRKELQEAEGGDGSGIAAELEAMQAQLGEARDQREHLELKLGERSAQLEQQQVQLDDMAQQVELGQQNAQQAEASACTAETERKNLQRTLDADRQKLEALNESLATTVSERDQVSEQLTVQKQELQELRVALQQMQEQESAGNQQLEQSLQARELELQSLQASIRAIEAEREAAQTAQQQARQDADRLLAEAEVTRGLLDMQAAGDSDSALREELEQVRKNVEVAVRLRSQADKKSQDLAAEVERLRTQLNASAPSAGNPGTAAMHIPSLDADDPHASVEMDTAIAALSAVEQALPPSTVSAPLLDELPAATASVAQGKGKSGIGMGLLAGLLIGGAVAFVVSWWLTGQQKTVASVSAVRQTGRVVLPVKAPQPTVPPVADMPRPPVARSVDRSEKKHLLASAESLPRSTPAPEPARETSPAPAVTPFSRGEPGAEAGGGAEKMPQAVVSGAEDRPEPAPVPAVVEPVVAQPGRIFSDSLTNGGSGPRMVQLNADIYLMGSGQTSANFDERPQHEVQLARFAIGQYEVTFDEYDRFAEATGRRLPADEGWGRGARPVIGVSWQDAVDYTHWLSEQTGNRYRLPTETEWEFSARTGSDKRFWWGNELEQKLANCFDCGNEAAGVKTVVVGNFAPSEWRLHDMAGNVMEWVQDCYQPDYSDMPSGGGAVELANCGNRVVRGGGYTSPGDKLRSAARDLRAPDSRLDNLGFRVVREY